MGNLYKHSHKSLLQLTLRFNDLSIEREIKVAFSLSAVIVKILTVYILYQSLLWDNEKELAFTTVDRLV